jgi:hypothetical protein
VSRRDDLADLARGIDLAIEPISAGTCFVDEVQLAIAAAAEFLQHSRNSIWRVGDLAVEMDFCLSSGLRNGNNNRFLVDIEHAIGVKLHDGPSPCA